MSQLELFVSSMTVAQLAHVAGLSLEQVAALVLGASDREVVPTVATRPEPSATKSTPRRAATAPTPADRNTRTKEGRIALEQAIMEFLGALSEPARALEIRRAVGGTSDQIRTRLNALIEAGAVAYEGRASATRYWVAP
ncbi:MAG: hypothetical protein KDK70_30370 [Myxococcales bacterium]|nr:hypothetical protein [Myxococcales bacterium]